MKTPEEIIEEFQGACLARLDEVHQAATVELDRVTRENAGLEAALAKVRHETGVLRGAVTFAQSECSLLAKVKAEQEARIGNLLSLLGERDQALAANDRPEPGQGDSAELAELRDQLVAAEDACKTSESEREDLDKEIASLRAEVTDLEKQLEESACPEPMTLATAAHEFLRDSRLLPGHLDAPLRLAPHDYLMGLTGALGAELPQ